MMQMNDYQSNLLLAEKQSFETQKNFLNFHIIIFDAW